jgi:hypothetical protein
MTAYCEGQSLHGMVPYLMPLSDETISHWASTSHCLLAVHVEMLLFATPHMHFSCRLSHPYCLTSGNWGVGHVPHTMSLVHALVSQHVLLAVHEKSEFWPSEGDAEAQHLVASMDVVPEVPEERLLSLASRHGNSLYSSPAV